jgi:maltose alpha-D-glucosyltransferase/alpha-amylase
VSTTSNYWYKNAVIYQLHVRSFHDGNGDGIGDFAGLLEKLDYLEWLGVSAIWLLPFYPSPLRDDGYDVSDYRQVNPAYGTLREFKAFVKAAHARGMRIITELIVNHTSDQHPWFQRARRAKPGSRARNYYVWSDTDTKYPDTRIIFTDTEISNWAWDPVAEQYYWHRFFSHQPDLNFDSPDVLREMLSIMRFWFEIGVDGLRLDAAPYLCVKDGTTNEGIPETHAIIKKMREVLDAEYPDRVLLAEANQWPEDVQPYFGAGDECQMAFHFPLMPRIFLSLASQDRFPIYDIMQQTPAIPHNCQWAIFLRNHDEMTLEMVTDRERAFMYEVYAPESHARINVGIRRRLAPLLGNDRRKIELLMSILLSMHGTPILYYGDEIGMGDNIFLKDRDGVRTPMQWSPDRNGGFSPADAQRLCLPVIQDSLYGYEATNVEAQMRNPSSLANWVKRIVAVRQSHQVFGEGSMNFLYPDNRHIIAYIREDQTDTVLCVANLAESAQAASLDLSRFIGRTPIEMVGWSAFPTIMDRNYPLTLPGNAFFWFLLRAESTINEAAVTHSPELPTIVLPRGWRSIVLPQAVAQLEAKILPKYLAQQRSEKNIEEHDNVHIMDGVELDQSDVAPIMFLLQIEMAGKQTYRSLVVDRSTDAAALSSAVLGGELARGRTGPREFVIYDAHPHPRPWMAMGQALVNGMQIQGRNGTFAFMPSIADAGAISPRLNDNVRCLNSETMISGIINNVLDIRLYREPEFGIHPEFELVDALQKTNFSHISEPIGKIVYEDADKQSMAIGIAYRFVGHRGTGREIALGLLRQRIERGRLTTTASARGESDFDGFGGILRYATLIGTRIAQFHQALDLVKDSPAFSHEPTTETDIQAELLVAERRIPEFLAPNRQQSIIKRLRQLSTCLNQVEMTRVHGNLTLEEIIVSTDDVFLSGLGGDPELSLEGRRVKRSRILDVATMSISFDLVSEELGTHISSDRTEGGEELWALVMGLARRAREAFYSGYEETMGQPINRQVLNFFRMQTLLKEYAKVPTNGEVRLANLERLFYGLFHEGGHEPNNGGNA